MSTENPEPIGLLELAERLNVPAIWLKREARAGRLPALKCGATFLFDMREIKREIARRLLEAAKALGGRDVA